jgi:predicted secreted protein
LPKKGCAISRQLTVIGLASAVIVVLLLVISWRPTPIAKRIIITEKGADRVHKVNVNDEILIQLPTRPSQRYMWYQTESSAGFTELRSSRFEPTGPDAEPGATEVQTFDYRAVTRGSYQLRFYLGAPKVTLKTIAFRFDVR